MSTTPTLPPHSYTLEPADPINHGGLPVWDEARRIVTFEPGNMPPLDDEWAPAVLADGREVEVRRSDCGLGCRCGGEYRMVSKPIDAGQVGTVLDQLPTSVKDLIRAALADAISYRVDDGSDEPIDLALARAYETVLDAAGGEPNYPVVTVPED